MRYISILSIILFLAVSCQNKEAKKAETTDVETTEVETLANYVLYELTIEGMTCTGCEETIEAGVSKVEGVGSIEANHQDGKAQLKFEEGKENKEAVKEAIETAGYKLVDFVEVSEETIQE